MKIQGEHHFNASRDEVWKAIQDPQILANSLPGVRRLEERGSDEYAISVSVGVGAVKGAYDGAFRLTDKQEAESCVIRATGRGSAGSVETVANMQLRDHDEGSAAMAYDADAKVTGALAGVGQRMIAAAARKTTEQFLAALDREIAHRKDDSPTTPVEDRPSGEPRKHAAQGASSAPGHESPAGRELTAARPRAFSPSGPSQPQRVPEWKLIAGSALSGFALALVGVAIGRWTARGNRGLGWR